MYLYVCFCVTLAKSVHTTNLLSSSQEYGEKDFIDSNNLYNNFCCVLWVRFVLLYKP